MHSFDGSVWMKFTPGFLLMVSGVSFTVLWRMSLEGWRVIESTLEQVLLKLA